MRFHPPVPGGEVRPSPRRNRQAARLPLLRTARGGWPRAYRPRMPPPWQPHSDLVAAPKGLAVDDAYHGAPLSVEICGTEWQAATIQVTKRRVMGGKGTACGGGCIAKKLRAGPDARLISRSYNLHLSHTSLKVVFSPIWPGVRT